MPSWSSQRPHTILARAFFQTPCDAAMLHYLEYIFLFGVAKAGEYHESFEAIERHFGGACDELHQEGQVLRIQRAGDFPEPVHHGRALREVLYEGVCFHVFDVNLRKPADKQL